MPEAPADLAAPTGDTAGRLPDRAAAVGNPEVPGLAARSREIGGPQGPEPTRFGDWERAGRCIDF